MTSDDSRCEALHRQDLIVFIRDLITGEIKDVILSN